MKALITGIGGFVGSYLAESLLSKNAQVVGLLMPQESRRNIASIENKLTLFEFEIADGKKLKDALDETKPEVIFHLAALSHVPTSLKEPMMTFSTNLMGTLNLYEAVRSLNLKARLLFISSSDVYGRVDPRDLPITEESLLLPLNPYSSSKACADLVSYQYALTYGLDIVRLRPFNHTGPRQSPQFVCSDFARQIATIEMNKMEPLLKVGNLEVWRDFCDVRDVVRGYWLAVEKGEKGEVYNLCSGQERSIREILMELLSYSTIEVKVQEEKERFRPVDIPIVRGDPTKFQKATGWQREIPFSQTLRDLLHYWRQYLGEERCRSVL